MEMTWNEYFLEVITILHIYFIGIYYAIVERFWQLQNNPYLSKIDKQFAIVTGGTSGIGLATVRLLLTKGFHVIVIAKRSDSSEWTQLYSNANNHDLISFYECDLSSMKQINQTIDRLRLTYERVHLLINNAAVMFYPSSKDDNDDNDLDMHIRVNLLSHAILIDRLLPLMCRASQLDNYSRIINVTSSTLYAARIDSSQLDRDTFGRIYRSGYSAYANSKLLIALYTQQLYRRWCDSANIVTIVCLHPGIVSTNLYRYAPTPFRQLINGPIGRALFRSTTDAAVDIFHLATIDNLKSGEYYENGYIKPIPIIDHVLIDKLYNRVQEIVDDCDLCTES